VEVQRWRISCRGSSVVRVDAVRPGEPDITLQLRLTVNGSIEEATPTLVLTFDSSFLVPDIRAYDLAPRQIHGLLAALASVVAVLPG
jgi:hypothetical protein